MNTPSNQPLLVAILNHRLTLMSKSNKEYELIELLIQPKGSESPKWVPIEDIYCESSMLIRRYFKQLNLTLIRKFITPTLDQFYLDDHSQLKNQRFSLT